MRRVRSRHTPLISEMTVDYRIGDCVEVMKEFPENHFDACVTDPPYGLEFMGKEWDKLASTEGNVAYRSKGLSPTKSEFKNGVGTNIGYPKKNPRCRNCGKLKFDHNPRRCRCRSPAWDTRSAEWAARMEDWHYHWALELWRVLKPGAHALVFGGTRTHHRLMCALEDAGFEIRDCLMWIYGSGFPKTLDVSKAIDK